MSSSRPSRSSLPLIAFFAASLAAMAWLGYRVISEDELVQAQRSQKELEQSANRLVDLSNGRLAELNQQLALWMVNPPQNAQLDDGILVIEDGHTINAFPPTRLLYRPDPPAEPEAPAQLFAAAEALEFRRQFDPAADAYKALADSKSPPIRAGALLRLVRTYRKASRKPEAIAACEQLSNITAAGFSGLPAGLLAAHALSELRGTAADNQALRDGLREARWTLPRGPFLFYWSEAKRLAAETTPPPSLGLTEAVYNSLIRWHREWPANGIEIVRAQNHPYLVLWNLGPSRSAMLVMDLDALLRQIARAESTTWAMTDRLGTVLAGRRESAAPTQTRVALDTGLPWTIYTSTAPAAPGETALRRLFQFGLALMLLLLALGSWFTIRAMRREMETARQQSEFVAAVSHEFRTPLTSLKHLLDMLLLGRVTDDDRRQQYYKALSGETARLQRLVESLLNFGRMEAGSHNYTRENVNVAELVSSTLDTFDAVHRDRITANGPPTATMQGDPAALSAALRNLVDNALKYSTEAVSVEWESSESKIMIQVTDHGPGILPAERKSVFDRFVRGSAAAAGNVKGTGLGLAMVRYIATAHNGQVRVENVPTGGCRFTLEFPTVGEK